jgi:co-chaperonin GroES (HSP10)
MIKPMPNWVAIAPVPRPSSIGSILLPDQYLLSEKKTEEAAVVVAVPSCCYTKKNKRIPSPVSVGDRILFRGFLKDLNKVVDGEQTYSLVNFQDILAVVEDPEIKVGVYGLST